MLSVRPARLRLNILCQIMIFSGRPTTSFLTKTIYHIMSVLKCLHSYIRYSWSPWLRQQTIGLRFQLPPSLSQSTCLPLSYASPHPHRNAYLNIRPSRSSQHSALHSDAYLIPATIISGDLANEPLLCSQILIPGSRCLRLVRGDFVIQYSVRLEMMQK